MTYPSNFYEGGEPPRVGVVAEVLGRFVDGDGIIHIDGILLLFRWGKWCYSSLRRCSMYDCR
jgi:hypothetical protein